MTKTETYQEQQLLLIDDNVLLIGHDAEWALGNIDNEAVLRFCLHRGMIVEPRTVEVTAEIMQEREFCYGWSGQLRERCTKRTERTVETGQRLKLWRSKARGWYWIASKESTMRDYSIVPLEINKYSDLDDLDEHEAKEAGWPPSLISAAVHEIHRREMEPNK